MALVGVAPHLHGHCHILEHGDMMQYYRIEGPRPSDGG